MRRAILPLVIVLLSALTAACGSTGQGDPCSPAHPPLEPGQPACTGGGNDAGCFVASEIYIETRSLQCRTRVCMVYQWDERAFPAQRSARVFCTCRCGGEGDPSAFCQCAEGFTCTTAFVAGEPGIRGSYCVRNEALGLAADAGGT